jgi:predicted nucleic acid-binding protein
MNSQICVDASLVIKLGLPEEGSDRVEALWREWRRIGAEVVAPPLLRYEITSVLCNAVHRRRIAPEEGLEVLKHLLSLPIRFIAPEDIFVEAWNIAITLGQPAAYDACYLAVAKALGCEFWTADEKLYRTAREKFPQIRLFEGSGVR